MKVKGLGRGLDALLEAKPSEDAVSEIEMKLIDTNSAQPRKNFDKEKLEELAQSIKEIGLLQPVLLEKRGERYSIVAGERRFRAAMLAGLSKIPALIKTYSAAERMEAALVENIQREDLNPIEEANAIYTLMKECNYTQEQLAKRLARGRSSIANVLRLLKLVPQVQKLVIDGLLSEGHARVLCGIEDTEKQRKLAEICVQRALSVRELERLSSEKKKKPAAQPIKSVEFEELEEKLLYALGTDAKIQGTLDKGKIVITYKHRSELEQIYEAIEMISDMKK